MWKVRFISRTRKELEHQLEQAYARGDLRLVKRITALLLCEKGLRRWEIAQTVQVCERTIRNWVKAFLLKGMASFVYKLSSGRRPKLTKTQKKALCALIEAGPLAYGLPTALWNSAILQQVIWKEYGVLYNRHYVCQLLRNWGFSFQKAKFVSDHLDEAKREEWRAKTWPEILKQAQARKAVLLFEDECSFPQWGSLGYTWARRGERPFVKTSGKRKGYKVFGVIEYFSGKCVFQAQEDRFNSDTYMQFLHKVLSQFKRPIILIHDGAKYHTSKATQAFVESVKERLTVYRLPSYSPDYNPIEQLWKKIKQRGMHNQYFPHFQDLKAHVDEALAYFQHQAKEVLALMLAYESLAPAA
jgi:transposase